MFIKTIWLVEQFCENLKFVFRENKWWAGKYLKKNWVWVLWACQIKSNETSNFVELLWNLNCMMLKFNCIWLARWSLNWICRNFGEIGIKSFHIWPKFDTILLEISEIEVLQIVYLLYVLCYFYTSQSPVSFLLDWQKYSHA